MNNKIIILPILMGALTAGPLHAADVSHGKSLQQKNCMGCHDDAIYTREDHKVTSLAGLTKQVKRCELSLGLQWFDDDVDDVIEYLNTSFYHYE